MKGTLMVDVFYREKPRGPLERVTGVFGPATRAEMWTLVCELRGLFIKYKLAGEDRANPSQEEEDRHAETWEVQGGHL